MNQQIQILDGFELIAHRNAIKLVAINAGELIDCFVNEVNAQDAHDIYQTNQFDIEEHLIELIENEKMTTSGTIEMSIRELVSN